MNAQTRTIAELEKKCLEIKAGIDAIETETGHRILTAQKERYGGEHAAPYTALEQEKRRIQDDIAEITEITAEKQRLRTQNGEEEKYLAASAAEKPELMLALGKAFYDFYSPPLSSSFGSYYTEAARIQSRIDELEKESAQLTEKISDNSFFNKISTRIKLSSLSSNIAVSKRRFNEIIVKGARDIWAAGSLKHEFNSRQLDSGIDETYRRCAQHDDSEAKCRTRIEEIKTAEKAIDERLAALEASVPERRKEQLSRQYEEKVHRQNEICRAAGHDFFNTYITREGDEIAEPPEEYAEAVRGVQSRRIEYDTCLRRIEILVITRQIEETDKHIAAMQQEIIQNDQRIEHLQKANAETGQRIEDDANFKDELIARRGNIELELIGRQKRLSKE